MLLNWYVVVAVVANAFSIVFIAELIELALIVIL